jgi:predicted deacetylase
MPTRRLFVSIHDVGPRSETEVDRLLDLIRPHASNRIAMLVVPNMWGVAPIRAGSPFASRLRQWAELGHEVFLHGFYHRDTAFYPKFADHLRAKWMTAGEGEFLGLGRGEARARIEAGRTLIESITGQPIAGFVAPAWLYGRPALDELRACGMPLAEDHWRVWSPATGVVLSRSPVITWASRSAARLRASLMAAAILRRAPVRDLRVGVHPGDCSSPRLLRSIANTLAVAARRRVPAAYSELTLHSVQQV